uniref:Cytoplasmic polyadenylation element-binding protein 3 n=1 Tax=Ascaris suum TaxID=6253 RepID=F1L1K2_ASCSU
MTAGAEWSNYKLQMDMDGGMNAAETAVCALTIADNKCGHGGMSAVEEVNPIVSDINDPWYTPWHNEGVTFIDNGTNCHNSDSTPLFQGYVQGIYLPGVVMGASSLQPLKRIDFDGRGRVSQEHVIGNNSAESHANSSTQIGKSHHSTAREVTSVWTGELLPRSFHNAVFSCKLFVGGIPWNITEPLLLEAFCKYGSCRVEWPSKEVRSISRSSDKPGHRMKVAGYVYLIFESETCVKKLLADCVQEVNSIGEWFFNLHVRRNQTTEIRQVQIIPWLIADADYMRERNVPIDSKNTVFVGALHGMLTAQMLSSIMAEVYGDVVLVSIDTDKYKYPIGSGRVTFSSHTSYLRAVDSAFLEIKTPKFSKKIQIDPYLEEARCSMCDSVQGPYFCRVRSCFKYYCLQCWQTRHSRTGPYGTHKALMRKPRHSVSIGIVNEANAASHMTKYRGTRGQCNGFSRNGYPRANSNKNRIHNCETDNKNTSQGRSGDGSVKHPSDSGLSYEGITDTGNVGTDTQVHIQSVTSTRNSSTDSIEGKRVPARSSLSALSSDNVDSAFSVSSGSPATV